jgi:hypothetical protein
LLKSKDFDGMESSNELFARVNYITPEVQIDYYNQARGTYQRISTTGWNNDDNSHGSIGSTSAGSGGNKSGKEKTL